jgi:hypothetical protein
MRRPGFVISVCVGMAAVAVPKIGSSQTPRAAPTSSVIPVSGQPPLLGPSTPPPASQAGSAVRDTGAAIVGALSLPGKDGSSVGLSAGNQLTNGSFEVGSASWFTDTACGDAAGQVSFNTVSAPAGGLDQADEGTVYARVAGTSATSAGSLCQNINRSPTLGDRYTLSFRVRSSPGPVVGSGKAELWELPGQGLPVVSGQSFGQLGQWTEETLTTCARTGVNTTLRVKFFAYSTSPVDFDNIRLTVARDPLCVVNPGATTAAVLTAQAPASNFSDGSFNAGAENWGVCREPSQQYLFNGSPPGTVSITHHPPAVGSFGPHISISSSVPSGNRACRVFAGAPRNGLTPHIFTAWVKSADGSNVPFSTLQLTGQVHQFSTFDPTDFVGSWTAPISSVSYFTATDIWQKVSVFWWPPTGSDAKQTIRDSFFASVVPGAPGKAILVDEVDQRGPFDLNPCNGFWSLRSCSGQGSGGGVPPKDSPLLPSERAPRYTSTGSSTSGLVVSWEAPSLGVPTGYKLSIFDIDTQTYLYQADLSSTVFSVSRPGGAFAHTLLYEVGAVYPDGIQWDQGVFDTVDGSAPLEPIYDDPECPPQWTCVA